MSDAKMQVEHYGVKLALNPDVVSEKIANAIVEGRYEHKEADALQSILARRERVLEIGGGLGFISTLAARSPQVESVRVYEANPGLIAEIRRTHALNGIEDVEVRNEILAHEPTANETSFYLRRNFWASSTCPEPWHFREEIRIPVADFAAALAEFRPTLIVCDIEGGELDLFRNAALPGVRKVLLEVHPAVIGEEGVRELLRAFRTRGFDLDNDLSTESLLVLHRPSRTEALRRRLGSAMRWKRRVSLPADSECRPDFLCIGAQKAGTSWLFRQLQSHPRVFLPPLKELHYFDHLFVPSNRKWTGWHIRSSARRLLEAAEQRFGRVSDDYREYLQRLASDDMFTEAWYREAFRRPAAVGKLKGDVTPEYCTIPQEGIDFLLDRYAPLKVIYIVRDPLSRALSQLRMNASRRREPPAEEGQWLQMANTPDIANRGDYRTYIPRWKASLPPDDLLFLPFGQIRSDPASFMREVEAFLGLAPHRYQHLNKKVHASAPLEVPEAARLRLAEITAAQSEFLAAEFPPEFIARL